MPTSTRISLELAEQGDVALQRVITLCRRRGLRIRHLEFARADTHRPGLLIMSVECASGRAGSATAWLQNLVGVTEVLAE